MNRLPDWRSRLAAASEARRREARTDFGLSVADAIVAMTDVDLAAPYCGRSETIAEGLTPLAADGYVNLCAFAAAHLGEVHPLQPRVGDVMAFPAPETGRALGIVNGGRVTVWRGDGLGTVGRDLATRAFRVPS